ncbi:MAG: phosphoribosylanthranilate isomerase [Syntrophaceae bacterium]|nr:phosphoribosylanthranilate isomerase [Syntrophaceae bacterium]
MERIQIAGIHDLPEAKVCLRAGVRQLGFPLGLDVHEEDCPIDGVRDIFTSLPRNIEKVVITYFDRAVDIVDLCRQMGVSMVQLHGAVDLEELSLLRATYPSLTIIKSLIVREKNQDALLSGVLRWSSIVDAFITDTFDPATGASGATGKTHDWEISRMLVKRSPKPVYLAGGLNPHNVAQAIRAVRPWGVDCHTGVEGPDGRKDSSLVKVFVEEAVRAFREVEALKSNA